MSMLKWRQEYDLEFNVLSLAYVCQFQGAVEYEE